MIIGIGTDIVVVERIQRMLDRHADTFTTRHFTAMERDYCDKGRSGSRAQRYAARFAAKEAVSKALGVGIGAEAGWLDIEVLRDLDSDNRAVGPPKIVLHGSAAATAKRLGVRQIWISLSHERDHALAFAILEN